MENTQQKSIFWFIAVFITAFILGFGLSRLSFFSGGQNNSAKDRDKLSADVFAPSLGNTIAVGDQYAGDSVFIALATLSRGAWVAVHEDINGIPGNILGARYFPAGKTAGAVELLRNTVPGNIYYALVHEDDGDHAFDFRTDAPLQDAFGNYTMAAFKTLSRLNGDAAGE